MIIIASLKFLTDLTIHACMPVVMRGLTLKVSNFVNPIDLLHIYKSMVIEGLIQTPPSQWLYSDSNICIISVSTECSMAETWSYKYSSMAEIWLNLIWHWCFVWNLSFSHLHLTRTSFGSLLFRFIFDYFVLQQSCIPFSPLLFNFVYTIVIASLLSVLFPS